MDEQVKSISEFLAKVDLHGGHRKRIYERIKNAELCMHEYLELLLFSALPRRNTNDLAHLLLSEFGDIWGVLSAPIEQLCKVDGVGESVACFLRTIGIVVEGLLKKQETAYPTHFNVETFPMYMQKEYGTLGCEVLDVYILDAEGKIYGRRRCSSLREKRVEVQIQWFMNVLLDFNPSGVLLVHNHPHGDATPSQSDDATTQECRSLCEKNGVIFCDHMIYSNQGIYSYNCGEKIRIKGWGNE